MNEIVHKNMNGAFINVVITYSDAKEVKNLFAKSLPQVNIKKDTFDICDFTCN